MKELDVMLENLQKEYEKAHAKLIKETKEIYTDCNYLGYVEEALVLRSKIEVLEDLQNEILESEESEN